MKKHFILYLFIFLSASSCRAQSDVEGDNFRMRDNFYYRSSGVWYQSTILDVDIDTTYVVSDTLYIVTSTDTFKAYKHDVYPSFSTGGGGGSVDIGIDTAYQVGDTMYFVNSTDTFKSYQKDLYPLFEVPLNDTLQLGTLTYLISSGDSSYVVQGGVQLLSFKGDSITYYVENIMRDSLRLPYLHDLEGEEQWLLLTTTNGVGTDSIVGASIGLSDYLFDINQLLSDTVGGEIAWRNPDGTYEYNIGGRPSETIFKLMWGIEHSYRYIHMQDARIRSLELRIREMEAILNKEE